MLSYMTSSSESILGFQQQQLIDDGLNMYRYLAMSLSTRYMGRLFKFLDQDDGSGVYTGFEGLLAIKNRDYQFALISSKLYKKTRYLVCFIYSDQQVRPYPLKLERIIDQDLFLRKNFDRFASLKPREKEVLSLLAVGYGNKEIADKLFNSIYTINTHRVSINKKLGIKSISDIYKYANAFDLI